MSTENKEGRENLRSAVDHNPPEVVGQPIDQEEDNGQVVEDIDLDVKDLVVEDTQSCLLLWKEEVDL